MNVFTATILSTKKQASSHVYVDHGNVTIFHKPDYALNVTMVDENTFSFYIHKITFPHRKEGKGLGEPHTEKPHFSKQFTREELSSFLTASGFDPEAGWCPVENEIEV